MKYKRYSGEFVGVDNTVWRAEIWQEAAAGSPGSERAQAPTSPQAGAIGELEFDASKPIEIEWPGTGKEEVIQGSSATLRIISPGDRSYIDLYSVEMCAVRLDVYRDDVLYWRGSLDTEFYEEPYEMYSGYTVSLTFSDFGVLERCKIYGHDTRSLYAVISECLEAADLGGLPIREDFMSTKPNASAEGFITLEDLYVSGDNFYDEDGAVITSAKSLDSTLGEWKEYTETGGVPGVWGYLAYYSGSDRENTAGVANGWAKNRPGINPHNDIITVQLSKTDGALLPYPDVGAGDLTVEVLRGGWKAIDDGCDFDKTYHSTNCEFWKRYDSTGKYKIRHIWFKLPEVEVVEAGLLCEALESEDYVYKAELAAEAQEDLEIDTICGSAEGGVALARGAYMDAGGAQVTELTREGITGQIEELLIGTLYSQYGRRHTVLSGEARLCAAGMEWSAFTDRAQAGKCFMLTSTVEDLRMGEMDAEFTEITADEYVSVKTESETDSEE